MTIFPLGSGMRVKVEISLCGRTANVYILEMRSSATKWARTFLPRTPVAPVIITTISFCFGDETSALDLGSVGRLVSAVQSSFLTPRASSIKRAMFWRVPAFIISKSRMLTLKLWRIIACSLTSIRELPPAWKKSALGVNEWAAGIIWFQSPARWDSVSVCSVSPSVDFFSASGIGRACTAFRSTLK
ncbi:hypothetical protein H113_00939 [Trichophyton rubrum MR1459]|nr:hypothetical protein H113_00939 [Trichophyton rubrum MR1459]